VVFANRRPHGLARSGGARTNRGARQRIGDRSLRQQRHSTSELGRAADTGVADEARRCGIRAERVAGGQDVQNPDVRQRPDRQRAPEWGPLPRWCRGSVVDRRKSARARRATEKRRRHVGDRKTHRFARAVRERAMRNEGSLRRRHTQRHRIRRTPCIHRHRLRDVVRRCPGNRRRQTGNGHRLYDAAADCGSRHHHDHERLEGYAAARRAQTAKMVCASAARSPTARPNTCTGQCRIRRSVSANC